MTKTRSTRSALVSASLILTLCVSALLGTTFAWFTDSVTSAGNIIKSGTLDVTMGWAEGDEDPSSVNWIDASAGAIFNNDLWEPGYVEVRHVKIANEGTLALKYQLSIIANGEVSDLADVIDVYYVDPAEKIASRDALDAADKIGTLTEVLANVSSSASGRLLPGENHTITIALKMQETAGNEYQNKSICTDFSVQLLATQLDYEEDSFGPDYDEDKNEIFVPFNLTLTQSDYYTISNPESEKLSCGPGLVYYGNGNFAVAYLADDVNTVETESSQTIVCRLGLFNLKNPEDGEFFDIAWAGGTIGDVKIGSNAPYEPNLLAIDEKTLLILFNIRDSEGKYVYYWEEFDTESKSITSYGRLTLDGLEWTPTNIAASYNAISDKDISASGPTGSIVFTSKIIKNGDYYYGFCGGVCNGFSGILVRSADGKNWESVMTPEAAAGMNGVIECGFGFIDDTVYFCMRDIKSGVYHCSYEWPTKKQLTNTVKISGITTSKPATFIQDGKLYLIVNEATTDESTMGRRNTALFYEVDTKNCKLKPVKEVFCKGGCAYHCVVEAEGVNYWCFHTDARWINPVTQGRSNLAFLEIPPLAEVTVQEEPEYTVYNPAYYAKGCISISKNPPIWISECANYHYQIPRSEFADNTSVTVTGNADRSSHIAFFSELMYADGEVSYAEGWDSVAVLDPGETVTLNIPSDAAYLYILNNNGAGQSLLPQQVVFGNLEVDDDGENNNSDGNTDNGDSGNEDVEEAVPTDGESLDLNVTAYLGCLTNSVTWTTSCGNYCYQFDISEMKAKGYTEITVLASEEGRAMIAMFTEQMPTSNVSGMTPYWATGWSRQAIIDPGQTQTFDIPDDARYLFVLYSGTNVSPPQSIIFSK